MLLMNCSWSKKKKKRGQHNLTVLLIPPRAALSTTHSHLSSDRPWEHRIKKAREALGVDVVWREMEDAPGTRSWNKGTDASQTRGGVRGGATGENRAGNIFCPSSAQHQTKPSDREEEEEGARGLTGRGSGLHAGTQGIKRESPGPVVLNPAFA